MAQEAPRPGVALFQRLFGRRPKAEKEEVQLRTLFELLGAKVQDKGDDYLNALAVHLSDILNVELCLISRAELDDCQQVQVVAHARRGKSYPTFKYTVAGTPCELAFQGSEYYLADGVAQAFPTDAFLVENGLRSYYGVPLWGENEDVIGVICLLDVEPLPDAALARDIIGMFAHRASAELIRIQAREQSIATDKFMRSFFHDFPGWVCGYTCSANGDEQKIVFSNGRGADLLGPDNYALLHQDATQFNSMLHPKDRDRVEAVYEQARQTHGSYDLEYRLRHDSGKYRWVQATGCFRTNPNQTIYSHSVLLDRDDFRRLERRHEELSQELQTLVRTIPDAVILQDGSGRVRIVNAAVETLFGLPSTEMVGRDFASLAARHSEHRELFEAAHHNTQRAFASGKRLETQACRPMSGYPDNRNIESVRIPLLDESGFATGLVTTVRDVTERVAARAHEDHIHALEARAGRLAALSRLVEGVAHEFENQLTAVLGYGDLSLAKLRQLPPTADSVLLERSLDRIREAAMTASGISRNLLAFSEASSAPTSYCEPASVIRAAHAALTSCVANPDQLSLELEVAPEGWELPLSDREFVDLLQRLLLNAAEASEDDQTIRLECAPLRASEAGSKPRYQVILEDQGEGIPRHLQERVFDPLFSTREDHSRRRGMGLAIVHNLVSRADGELQLHSEVGKGTRFELNFPLNPASSDDISLPIQRPRILVVDDQQPVRDLMREILEAGEYEVVTASSWAEAIALKIDPKPNLLLIDVLLEDGLGTKLAETLNQRWPDIPALFCSGLSAEHMESRGVRLPAGRLLLAKPFRPTELLAATREALAGFLPTLTIPS